MVTGYAQNIHAGYFLENHGMTGLAHSLGQKQQQENKNECFITFQKVSNTTAPNA
jgi:hypothetical protein